MKSRPGVRLTAYLVSGVYAIVLFLLGLQLPHLIGKLLAFLPTLIVLLFAAFDTLLWRIQPIRFAVRKRPRLRGTWQGTLSSQQRTRGGKEINRPDIPIFLAMRQSFTELSITLLTSESKSRSTIASIQQNANGDFSIYYHYQNSPSVAVRERSPVHLGGAVIEVTSLDPQTLTGEYWTDRWSRGDFNATRVSRKCFGSFAEATSGSQRGA